MSTYFLNDKGERVYGYTKKPAPAVQPAKKTATAQPSAKATTASQSVYDAYAAAVARQNRLLKQKYDDAQRQQEENLRTALENNSQRAQDSMQQAYILNMMQQKNLPQRLKSNGISGGGAETVTRDMYNTYMNNRAAINRALLSANARAQSEYTTGTQQAYQKYLQNQISLVKSSFASAPKSAQQALYNVLKASGLFL